MTKRESSAKLMRAAEKFAQSFAGFTPNAIDYRNMITLLTAVLEAAVAENTKASVSRAHDVDMWIGNYEKMEQWAKEHEEKMERDLATCTCGVDDAQHSSDCAVSLFDY